MASAGGFPAPIKESIDFACISLGAGIPAASNKDGATSANATRASTRSPADFSPAKLDQQRNMDGFVIKQHSMPLFSMFSERFSVIGRDCDDRVLVKAVPLQDGEEVSEHCVGICNFPVIRSGGIPLLEGRRRIIRIMGIVEMHPDEKRTGLVVTQPCERMIGDYFGPPLHAAVAILTRSSRVEVRVIDVEAALKARRGTGWIQNVSPHKRSRVVMTVVQQVGQVREVFSQRRPQVLHMAELGISACQQRGMGRSRERHLRICPCKNHALLSQLIQVRRQPKFRA